MPHKISWYLPNSILQATYSGDLTQDDILASGKELVELSYAASSRHYLIVDSREVGRVPLNFQHLLQNLDQFRGNPHIVCTLVVSDNALLKFLSNVASKAVTLPLRTFLTLDEAYAYIAHNAPELASALPSPE